MSEKTDLLVVGSGAGALAAAVRALDHGLGVTVIEKSAFWGGTSAISGGALWLPANGGLAGDDPRIAAGYMRSCIGAGVDEERLEAYIQQVPRTLEFLKSVSVELRSNPEYPDYRQDYPGAMPGGRTMDPQPFDGALLGPHFHTLRDQLPFMKVFGRISLSNPEGRMLSQRRKGWIGLLLKMMAGYWLDIPWRMKTIRGRRLTMGSSLVAPLGKALFDRGGSIRLQHRLSALKRHEDGSFVASVETPGGTSTIQARAVVLAAGGFEHSQALRSRWLPPAAQRNHSASPKGMNQGETLEAAMQAGAATANLQNAWWAPSMRGPMGNDPDAVYVLFMERAFPGSVILNKRGERFANEAKSYNDFGLDMIADQERTGGSSDVWLIFDAGYRKRYMVGPLMAGEIAPDKTLPKDWLGRIFHRADSLKALATEIGLPAEAVEASIDRFNAHAEQGRDPDFGRGDNVYDRYFGDQAFENPNLGPVKDGPFYAVRIVLGDLGTNGGLKTDRHGNVVDEAGAAMNGLYAVGNTAASVMGPSYPGAGGTLGPAVSFGVAAADHAATYLKTGS